MKRLVLNPNRVLPRDNEDWSKLVYKLKIIEMQNELNDEWSDLECEIWVSVHFLFEVMFAQEVPVRFFLDGMIIHLLFLGIGCCNKELYSALVFWVGIWDSFSGTITHYIESTNMLFVFNSTLITLFIHKSWTWLGFFGECRVTCWFLALQYSFLDALRFVWSLNPMTFLRFLSSKMYCVKSNYALWNTYP